MRRRLTVGLVRNVESITGKEDVRVLPELLKVRVGGVVPNGVGIEAELVGEEGDIVALLDYVGLHRGSRTGERLVRRRFIGRLC